MVCTHGRMLFSDEKEGNFAFVTMGMDLESILLSKKKSDRERQILYDLIYM